MSEPGTPHNWGEFAQRQSGAQNAATSTDFDEMCATALTGSAGERFLAALRAQYIDRPENPNAPESVLRVRVTQQQFVRDLEAARDRGIEAMRRRAEAKKSDKPPG